MCEHRVRTIGIPKAIESFRRQVQAKYAFETEWCLRIVVIIFIDCVPNLINAGDFKGVNLSSMLPNLILKIEVLRDFNLDAKL